MINLSNEVKAAFIAYAQAHNEQKDTGEIFDALADQLESEYYFQLADIVLDGLSQCGRDENGNDIILTEANMNNINNYVTKNI